MGTGQEKDDDTTEESKKRIKKSTTKSNRMFIIRDLGTPVVTEVDRLGSYLPCIREYRFTLTRRLFTACLCMRCPLNRVCRPFITRMHYWMLRVGSV